MQHCRRVRSDCCFSSRRQTLHTHAPIAGIERSSDGRSVLLNLRSVLSRSADGRHCGDEAAIPYGTAALSHTAGGTPRFPKRFP
jgi:hypothetical protein